MPYVTSWERIAEKRGKKKGKEAGMKEAYKTTAIKMLKEGVEKKIIANVTGFPLDRIEELAAEAFQNRPRLNEPEPARL